MTMAGKGSMSAGKAVEDDVSRGLALRTVTRLEAALEHSKTESSALTRWLLGALVAMNLVAVTLVALLASSLAAETVQQGLAAFALGALCAFMAALVAASGTIFMTRMIRSAAGEWIDVATNGTDSAMAVAAARRMRRFANLWRAVLIVAGLVSLLLLAAGGLVVAQDIATHAFRAQAANGDGAAAQKGEASAANGPVASDVLRDADIVAIPSVDAAPAVTAAAASVTEVHTAEEAKAPAQRSPVVIVPVQDRQPTRQTTPSPSPQTRSTAAAVRPEKAAAASVAPVTTPSRSKAATAGAPSPPAAKAPVPKLPAPKLPVSSSDPITVSGADDPSGQ